MSSFSGSDLYHCSRYRPALPRPAQGAALLKMAFMQRAMDKQRARAKEEASLLLRELEEASAAAAEDDSDADTRVTDKHKSNRSGNGSSSGGGSNASARDVSTEERARAAEEMAEALPVGTLRPSAVGMDSRARSSVSAPITVDLHGSSEGHDSSDSMHVAAAAGDAVEQNGKGAEVKALKDGAVEGLPAAEVSARPDLDPATEGLGGLESGDRGGGVGGYVLDDGEEESDEGNPWLAPTPRRSRERRRASAATGEVLLDVGKAAATALSAFGGALSGGGDKDSGIDGKQTKKDIGGGNIHTDDVAIGSNGGGNGGDSAVAMIDNIEVQRNNAAKKRKKRQGVGGGGDCRDDGSVVDASEGGVARQQESQEPKSARKKGKKDRGRSERKAAIAEEKLDATVPKSKPGGVGEGFGSASAGTEIKENEKTRQKKRKMKRVEDRDEAGGKHGKSPDSNDLDLEGKVEMKALGSEEESGVKRPKRMGDSNGNATAVTGQLAGLSNDELVRRAFAAPDFEAEFKASKDDEIEAEVAGQGREKLPKEMAGWGSWTGEGAPVASGPSKREMIALKEQVCVAAMSHRGTGILQVVEKRRINVSSDPRALCAAYSLFC